jgi:hypothetical protein
LLIDERNASHIASQFNDSDENNCSRPSRLPPQKARAISLPGTDTISFHAESKRAIRRARLHGE